MADRSLLSSKSFTAISASDTGEDAPLVQFFSSVRNSDNASAPAYGTVSASNAASRVRISSCIASALTSAKRQSLDAHRRSIDAITEFQVVGGHQRFEYLEKMPRDRHLAHRIGDLAIFNPETGCAAAVVAGHAIDARTNQVGDVKSLLDVGHQFSRSWLPRFEMQIIRSRRRRRRYAAVGVAGRDQSQFPRGRTIQQPRCQHALIDDGEFFDLYAFGVERLRAQAAHP